MPGIDANNAVKEAQSVLNRSMKVPGEQQFAPKAKMPAAPKPQKSLTSGEEIASSLNSKAQNIDQYLKSLPKLHTGGIVNKDGAYQMKAGETVRTPEQEKKMQDHIKKASSAAQAMTKDEPKKKESKPVEKKAEKKDGKKKHHAHKVEVEKKKGGYLVKTHQQPEEGQPQQQPEESVHPDMASVNQHLNDVMGPEEEAAPAAAPQAAPAAQPTPGV